MKYNLFNIPFVNGNYISAINKLKLGAFMVVPSGPGLATIDKDIKYWTAIKKSDFALPDSGFMVLLCRLYYGKKLKKLSGAKFIKLFLNEIDLKEENTLFLVDPNQNVAELNRDYFNKINIPLKEENQYVAPIYDKNNIVDSKLIEILENLKEKPKFVLINLGGGVQERLGYYLKNNLSFPTGIICTGAAISFLTGVQAQIPNFVDKMYLGWLFRILQNPNQFLMRYLKAFRLIYIFYLDKKGKLK
jgi:exopolysaccharide biosynthesis WecB/TagA/CpsF family protein|tara:strand:- start:1315 stop:2052 length:738 start_codon:yes stop_codon:yes gene_type:complete